MGYRVEVVEQAAQPQAWLALSRHSGSLAARGAAAPPWGPAQPTSRQGPGGCARPRGRAARSGTGWGSESWSAGFQGSGRMGWAGIGPASGARQLRSHRARAAHAGGQNSSSAEARRGGVRNPFGARSDRGALRRASNGVPRCPGPPGIDRPGNDVTELISMSGRANAIARLGYTHRRGVAKRRVAERESRASADSPARRRPPRPPRRVGMAVDALQGAEACAAHAYSRAPKARRVPLGPEDGEAVLLPGARGSGSPCWTEALGEDEDAAGPCGLTRSRRSHRGAPRAVAARGGAAAARPRLHIDLTGQGSKGWRGGVCDAGWGGAAGRRWGWGRRRP